MPNPIIDIAFQQKRELAANQSQLTNNLTRAYSTVLNNLQRNIEDLQNQILAETRNGTQEISQFKLFRLTRYQSLQTQITEQLQRYGNYVDLETRTSIPNYLTLGTEHSFILVRDQFNSSQGQRAITTAWDKLNIDQIETALSFLSGESPFSNNLSNSLGESVADAVEQAIVRAVIIGKNPRNVASEINRTLGLGLSYSLNTARTAQIYAYRTATSLNYRNNSNIVGNWTWLSARDMRTCTSCLANHGRAFELDAILNDHHQGRCTQLPNIKDSEKYGLTPTAIESGEEWFNTLSASQQTEIMGPEKLQAYRNNLFQFIEQSTPYENSTYGTMLRETTLRELLNE